ncbi:MAG: hypothetical protein V3U24_01230 [Candidatus Neomarinimicrobiota bacterium]
MSSYPESLLQKYAVVLAILTLSGCSEEAFLTDLDNTPLKVHIVSSTAIQFKSYQIPPMLGNYPVLFLGTKDDYVMPLSLMSLASLDVLRDSQITIDSAFVQITINSEDSDTSLWQEELTLGFFFDFDSSYSESETNYFNIDELVPETYPFLDSSRVGERDTLSPYVRFHIEPALIETWVESDTTEPLFILESAAGDFAGLYAFHSSEKSEFYPFMKVFYTTEDTAAADTGTIIRFRSDVTIVTPPSLEVDNFDSTRSYVGWGAGLRSLVFVDIDSLGIPGSAVITRGNLILPVDFETSLLTETPGMAFQMFLLQDSVEKSEWGESEWFNEDIFDPLSPLGIYYSGTSIQKDSTLALDISDIVQGFVVKKLVNDVPLKNFGFKLVAHNSSPLFDHVAFHTAMEGDLSPRIEVLYETP